MAAGIYDIVIEQGATFSKTITLKNSNGSARDLTSVTSVRGQVRRTFSDSTAYAFTAAVTSPATNGIISWTMSADITSTLNPVSTAPWVYDLEMVFSSGVVERILQGQVTISLEVTK